MKTMSIQKENICQVNSKDIYKEVNLMAKIISYLEGKKTYIGIGLGVIYGLLVHFGIVPQSEIVWGALATWTGVSVRLAINKK